MQTKITSHGKKLLALMLSLLMLVSVLPVSAWAAANAKPEKITLVGSSDALEYEFVDYLTFAWEDIPHYKVYPRHRRQQHSGAVAGPAGRLRYGCDGHSLPQKAQPVTYDHWLTHSPRKLPVGSFLGFLSPCIRRAVVHPSAQGPKFSSDKRFGL